MNGSSLPKWFLGLSATALFAFFIWTTSKWIERVDFRLGSLEESLEDYRQDQIEYYIWLSQTVAFKDLEREKELRNRLMNLRKHK